MKKHIISIQVLFLIILMLGCSQNDFGNLNQSKRQIIRLDEDEVLKNYINLKPKSNNSSSSKQEYHLFSTADWSRVLREQFDSEKTVYSVPIPSIEINGRLVLRNLIIVNQNKAFYPYTIRMYTNQKTIPNIELTNENNEILLSTFNKSPSANGRSEAIDCYEIMITYPATIEVGGYSSTTYYTDTYRACSTGGGLDGGSIISGDGSVGGSKLSTKSVSIVDNKQMQIDLWEDQIDSTLLKPCMQKILSDLKRLTQGSIGQIIQKFSGNVPDYNWEMTDGALNGSVAETNPPGLYNKTTRTIKTTFDSQAWLNATELSWARTILHESVHANLSVYFATDAAKFISTYPQMVQDYGTLKNWNAVHHEEFARSVVNTIADALENYGKNKGYNLSRQFYEDMSWAGLQATSTFKNLPQSDQSRILDVIAIEISGKDIQGNTKPQVGKKAGC
jgi:hypothetical protein